MIKNGKQYASALRNLDNFITKIKHIEAGPEKSALISLKNSLENDIQQYIEVRDGKKKTFNIKALREIPDIIINSRISKKLSQKDLADIIEVAQQQINRWENTDYEKASFWHLLDVCEALEINFDITATLKNDGNEDEFNEGITHLNEYLNKESYSIYSQKLPMIVDSNIELIENKNYEHVNTKTYLPTDLCFTK
jgi:DNA-binding Xre family transcriptional regulator